MTYRKNKVVCPWCGHESTWMRDSHCGCLHAKGVNNAASLTSIEYPIARVRFGCEKCGKPYVVTAEKCIFYNTMKVVGE